MERVRELTLTLDAESWSLRINKDEWFEEGSRRTKEGGEYGKKTRTYKKD